MNVLRHLAKIEENIIALINKRFDRLEVKIEFNNSVVVSGGDVDVDLSAVKPETETDSVDEDVVITDAENDLSNDIADSSENVGPVVEKKKPGRPPKIK